MPQPPPLALLNAEEQWLFSKLLLDVQAPWPISKDEPSHPTKEAHFGRFYSQSYSFSHYAELMTVGESWDVGRIVSFAICLSSLFITTDGFSVRITADAFRVHLSISRSIFPSLMNKTLRYLNFSTLESGFLE